MRPPGTRATHRALLTAWGCALLAAGVAPAPASGAEAPVLAAVGDIACAPSAAVDASNCHQQQTADLVVGAAPTAVALLGDTQYEHGTTAEYMGSFDPTWGRLKSLTWPVPGNHEYGTAGAAGYFGYFGARAGDPALGYYSYDLGAWHLIGLNSNCADPPSPGPPSCANVDTGRVTAAEVAWLKQDLAAHPGVCTLAYWHHPRFSSGIHGNDPGTAALWEALYANDADLVLSGHDHDYERFGPQDPSSNSDPQHGIREFVVGTGGKSHFAFLATPSPNSELRYGAAFGVLFLTLRDQSYDWSFRAEDGTVVDSGSSACHSGGGGAGAPVGGAASSLAAPSTAAAPANRITSLRITPSAFAAATRGASVQAAARRRRHIGATLSYTLDMAANVRLTIERKRPGRRQGSGTRARCVAPTRKNRRAPRCSRLVARAPTLTLSGKAGPNRFRFTGRLAGRKLEPGSYVLVAVPVSGRRIGKATSTAFRITR